MVLKTLKVSICPIFPYIFFLFLLQNKDNGYSFFIEKLLFLLTLRISV